MSLEDLEELMSDYIDFDRPSTIGPPNAPPSLAAEAAAEQAAAEKAAAEKAAVEVAAADAGVPMGGSFVIVGLVSKTERNGQTGKVVGFRVDTGRASVEMDGSDDILSLKPANLQSLPPAELIPTGAIEAEGVQVTRLEGDVTYVIARRTISQVPSPDSASRRHIFVSTDHSNVSRSGAIELTPGYDGTGWSVTVNVPAGGRKVWVDNGVLESGSSRELRADATIIIAKPANKPQVTFLLRFPPALAAGAKSTRAVGVRTDRKTPMETPIRPMGLEPSVPKADEKKRKRPPGEASGSGVVTGEEEYTDEQINQLLASGAFS